MGSEPTSSWFSLLLQPPWTPHACLQCSCPFTSSRSLLKVTSSQVFFGYAPLFSLTPPLRAALDTDMSTAPGWNLVELVAGAPLNWNPALTRLSLSQGAM